MPKNNPQYIGRIDYPEYNCYVIRKIVVKDNEEWMDQRLYRLDNNEEVGLQQMTVKSSRLTANGLLDNILWKVDRKLSQKRYQEKQKAYFSGPYQQFTLSQKQEYWVSKCHFMKRVSFEESSRSPATVILNREWEEEQAQYHSHEDLQAIIDYIIKEFEFDHSVALEMLKHSSKTEPWRKLSRGE